MHRLLFICHGNICRSPMAEFVMKDIVQKAGKKQDYFIDSAAVSREEIGNGIHYGTKSILKQHNIPFDAHTARQMTKLDAEQFDLILCMDASNIRYAKQIAPAHTHHKIRTLLPRNIADPWYTGNFDETYSDIQEGCQMLFEQLNQK